MALTSFITIRTAVEGLHRWPDAVAPDAYLAHVHRHLFVITADITVFHNDREIEINAATRWLGDLLAGFAETPGADGPPDFGPQSCEHLARRATLAITERYGPHRHVRCTVLEDGILGAGITWEPDPVAEAR
jgi:hypothetical protein